MKLINKILKYKINNSTLGFSLVELIMVMAVMGVLASAVIAMVNPVAQLKKARDSQRKSDLRQIQSALEMYRADNGNYPASIKNCNGATAFGNTACTTLYMSKVPNDPKGASYTYTLSGSTYTLVGCLENLTDAQADSPFVNCTIGGASGHTITVINP